MNSYYEGNPLLFNDEESENSFLSNEDFNKECEKIFKYEDNNSNILDNIPFNQVDCICGEKLKFEENQSKIETQNSTNNENNNNIIKIIKEKNKPGRKTEKTSKKKKTHGRTERGNIYSKIKNYFINKVIIKHLNKKIKDYFGNQKTKFRKIKYKNNNIRNKNDNRNLLCKKLKYFLIENKISKKFKKKNRNQNKKTIEILENKKNLNYEFEENFLNLLIDKKEPNIYECLEMTIETFYKEIFLKEYLDKFINENVEKEKKKEKEKEKEKDNDVDYIQKLKEETKNFIEYYNDDENEKNNYLSKKRKSKSIFKITYDKK